MSTRRQYDPDHCTACGDFLPCGESWIDNGCDCIELCSMGPTCPGGMLTRLPGAGCFRNG